MNLIRPYGETSQSLSVAEDERERCDVARRLISQSADMCLMCACALDSAFMDGRPMPDGIYHEQVTEAVERALLQAARDLSAVQSVLQEAEMETIIKTNRASDLLFEVGNSLHSASRLLAEYMDGEDAQRELWCIMETLDANAKKADECSALLGEVAELLRG